MRRKISWTDRGKTVCALRLSGGIINNIDKKEAQCWTYVGGN